MLARNKTLFLPQCDTVVMVSDAIDYLCKHEPPEGYYVGFSGGKDSIVTLDLCKRAGVKHRAYYSCTRIDPPEVVAFIRERYPDVQWLYPDETFYSAVRRKAPPMRMVRWCCDTLKKEPGRKIDLPHRVMGLRAEESTRRAARGRTSVFKKLHQTVYKPIFFWSEFHVWDYIEQRRLAYPSLYDEGFARIGCVICPFIMGKGPGARAKRAESMRRWSGMWKAFERACREWFEALPEDKQRRKESTFEIYWQRYLDGFE